MRKPPRGVDIIVPMMRLCDTEHIRTFADAAQIEGGWRINPDPKNLDPMQAILEDRARQYYEYRIAPSYSRAARAPIKQRYRRRSRQ